MKFMGRNRPHNIVTVGFSESSDRQFMIWDDRNVKEPLKVNKLDSVSNVGILHYDDDNNTLYVVDKGSRSWHTHYYTDNNGPLFTKIEDSQNKENTIGFYFLPKRIVDI